MQKIKIEWVKNPDGSQGYTWNPITGCLNGCEYCYARKLANGRLKKRYLANHRWTTEIVPHKIPAVLDPFYPRFWEERIEDPLKIAKPCGIFTCDMGELFGSWLPYEWQEVIFNVIRIASQHRFYLLTKQPQNLAKFSPFPDNCWIGVTATGHDIFYQAMRHLVDIKASIKFISADPLLERVALAWKALKATGIRWLIIGTQTKPYKPPQIEWVQEIVEAADRAKVKVFLKDNLRPLFGNILPYWALQGWGYRQEMPDRRKGE